MANKKLAVLRDIILGTISMFGLAMFVYACAGDDQEAQEHALLRPYIAAHR